MRGFGLLTTFIVVALTTTLVELRSVRSRTKRDIPTECPAEDPIETTIHLAHESNCSLFYKCYLGEKILYSCPTGVYFNPELQVCDWPESAGCALTGTSESEGTDTEDNQNSGDSEDNEESEDAEPESSDDADNDENGSEGAEESEDAAEPEAESEDGNKVVIPTECPAENGEYAVHIAHETDCSKYYICNHGEKIEQQCAGGLGFNPTLQVCDWAENVGCALSGSGDTEGSDHSETESENDDTESSDDADNHEDADDSEDAEESEDAAEPEAESEDGNETVIPTECPAENGEYAVHIAHETDCSKYYICNHGEKIEQQCASGLGFNPTLQVCDWAENVGCTLSGSGDTEGSDDAEAESENDETESSDDAENHEDEDGSEGAEESEDAAEPEADSEDGNETVIPTECPAENGEYAVHIAHETDCSKYYICKHGEKIEQQCASGLGFNPTLQVCDWAENVGCTVSGSGDTEDSDHSEAESESDETESSDDADNHEDADGSGGAEESEDTAEPEAESEDENETVIPTECPAENGDYAVHIAHETDCSKFYICNHGEKIEQQCSSGLGFNPTLQVCDWAENVGCTVSGSGDTEDSDHSEAESENDETESSDDADNHEDADGSGGAEESEDDVEPEDQNETVIPTECPAENGDYAVHIAHESDCSKFYKCNHGEKFEIQCPSGLEFNAALQICDWPENAGCTLSGSSDSDNSDDSTDTEHTPSVTPDESDDSTDSEDNGSVAPDDSDDSTDSEHTPSVTPAESDDSTDSEENASVTPDESDDSTDSEDNGSVAPDDSDDSTDSEHTPSVTPAESDDSTDSEENASVAPDESDDSTDSEHTPSVTPDESNDSTDSEDSGSVAPDHSDNSNDAEDNTETEAGSGDTSGTESGTVIVTECPAENGDYAVHLAHESDCGKYYLCNHGEKIERECPDGLQFNTALQVCDWPESAGCTLSGSSDSDNSDDSTDSEHTPSVTPDESDDSTDSEDSGSVAPDHSDNSNDAEDNTETEAGSGDTSGTESGTVIVTECPAENGDYAVHLAHESDCGKYYLCNHGEKIERECPNGLEFNAALQVCDWPENAGCALSGSSGSDDSDDSTDSEHTPSITPDESDDSTDSEEAASGAPDHSDNSNNAEDATEPEAGSGDASGTESGTVIATECPAENGDYVVHVAHESDCGKYYICDHGAKIERECPDGLQFNTALQVCDWPETAGCTLSGSSDSDNSDDSTDSEHTPSVTPDESNDSTDSEDSGSVAPDHSDNSNDAEDNTETETGSGDTSGTESGTVIVTECPAENGDYAVHLAHESDCGKYYLCNHGEKIERECPNGLEFNAALQVCDWPEFAGCSGSGSETEIPVSSSTVSSSPVNTTESVTQVSASAGDCDLAETNNVCPATDPMELSILYAHSDADKFCICSNGVAYVLECPDGLLFNDDLKVCDWPASA